MYDSHLASTKCDLEVDVLTSPTRNQTSNVAKPVHHNNVAQENDFDVQQ